VLNYRQFITGYFGIGRLPLKRYFAIVIRKKVCSYVQTYNLIQFSPKICSSLLLNASINGRYNMQDDDILLNIIIRQICLYAGIKSGTSSKEKRLEPLRIMKTEGAGKVSRADDYQ